MDNENEDSDRTEVWARRIADGVADFMHPTLDRGPQSQSSNHGGDPVDYGSPSLTVEVKSSGSALEPEVYAFMQEPEDREAYLHYTESIDDPALRKLVLQRRLEVKRKLRERHEQTIRVNRNAQSSKKVKYNLSEVERAHVTKMLLDNIWFKARPGSPRMKQITELLGGYGMTAYEIILSKWIDNNAGTLFLNHGWSPEDIKRQCQPESSRRPWQSSLQTLLDEPSNKT